MGRPEILIVGAGMWPWYEAACARALESLGCGTSTFSWLRDFYDWPEGSPEPRPRSLALRVQNRLLAGPTVERTNRRLLELAVERQPDVVWLYNATHVLERTVRRLREGLPGARLVHYANDNPFGRQRWYWRHQRRAIPLFDVCFAYRPANLCDYREAGAREVRLLRSYYVPEVDHRVELGPADERFRADVVFAGHYEEDGRLGALEKVAARHRLNLFGGGWSAALSRLEAASPLRRQFPVAPVVGPDYRKAVSGASIALCFLSKLNQDSYTRRNFEIPAMGTFMLSEYSDDLAGLFAEGVEAEFFRSEEELLDKIGWYTRNAEARERVAACGRERVLRDGHDVRSRMRAFLDGVSPGLRSRGELP
jgi:spore maturation protein CgeB